MPILPAEPDCNPADLWEEGKIPPPDEQSVWWCLHTKPRQEKATARELRKGGVSYYLPQVLKESRTPQGRMIRSVVPLFPSYLFLHGSQEDRLTSVRGNRLVNVLEVTDQAGLTRDLRQIHAMLGSGRPVSEESTVPVGASFRIATGPLMGMVGKVIRRGKKDQFVAVVRFLGRGATVDLQDWQVEQVSEPEDGFDQAV
jgi:transcriptional antiterminator RfaH